VALIIGHKPKRQKHVSALIVGFATGCKAPGFIQTINSPRIFANLELQTDTTKIDSFQEL
jgi:hypothetical protein